MENFLMTPMSILFKCGPGVYRQLQLLIKKTIERRVWKFEGMDTRRIFSSGRGKNMHRKKIGYCFDASMEQTKSFAIFVRLIRTKLDFLR